MLRYNNVTNLAMLVILMVVLGTNLTYAADDPIIPVVVNNASDARYPGSLFSLNGNNNQAIHSPSSASLASPINPCRNTTVVGIYALPARDPACAAQPANIAQPIGARCGNSGTQSNAMAIGGNTPCGTGGSIYGAQSANTGVWVNQNSYPQSLADQRQDTEVTGLNGPLSLGTTVYPPVPFATLAAISSTSPVAQQSATTTGSSQFSPLNPVNPASPRVRTHVSGSTATAIGSGSHASIGGVHVR